MTNDRANLAHQQHAALHSILKNSPAPAGLNPDDLQHTAKTLHNKRRRELALIAPLLIQSLAENFPPLFHEFTTTHTYPARGGPLADALHFTTFLRKSKRFPPAALLEAITLRARTGFPLQFHRAPRTLFVTFRRRGRVSLYPLIRIHKP